jgi:hypothetical protein
MTATTTERKLISTDQGTHGGPQQNDVYRNADGSYQHVYSFGRGLISSERTKEYPAVQTPGRMRRIAK